MNLRIKKKKNKLDWLSKPFPTIDFQEHDYMPEVKRLEMPDFRSLKFPDPLEPIKSELLKEKPGLNTFFDLNFPEPLEPIKFELLEKSLKELPAFNFSFPTFDLSENDLKKKKSKGRK